MMDKVTHTWDRVMVPWYHFTTYDTFKKIHTSREIRLTPCSNIKNAGVETMALYTALYEIIADGGVCDVDRELIEKLEKIYRFNSCSDLINQIINDRENTYIACFSNIETEEFLYDDMSFYMWKYYGDNENGVLIKFNYECFPYTQHGSNSVKNNKGEILRTSEVRVDEVKYSLETLRKAVYETPDRNTLLFATDIYKPDCCRLENEIRMLFYLNNPRDLKTIDRLIPKNEDSEIKNDSRPDYIHYQLHPADKMCCITKVYCLNENIKNNLIDLLGKDMVVNLSR